ncbi:hypothetical protein SanaruYs_35040 [Chryseotalea sanaruensis]|uniref:Outer membrane protein beta-barrel domain-containing protein n=1 Tax=Chryseotalea sanaruensis TaxID=2482724 RepID=A0A401UEC4_9BACT|nr:hypothetical protein [Chryseotalea sanaruensis]GCC53261.1 hypothetical protein SanaruYs_35040 [Chryseotalea sanaruensis]
MVSKTNYKVRGTNAMLLIILFLILGVYSCIAQQKQRVTVIGNETSFGMHRFFSEGDGSVLRDLHAFSNGVSTGFYAGNRLVKTRIRVGFYNTASYVTGEVRILEKDLLIDVYPLEFFRTHINVLDVYLTTGVSHHTFSEKESLKPGYISTRETGVPTARTYQVVGIGLAHLPLYFNRSTSFFAEVLLYNSITFSSSPESNVFLNVGMRKKVARLSR